MEYNLRSNTAPAILSQGCRLSGIFPGVFDGLGQGYDLPVEEPVAEHDLVVGPEETAVVPGVRQHQGIFLAGVVHLVDPAGTVEVAVGPGRRFTDTGVVQIILSDNVLCPCMLMSGFAFLRERKKKRKNTGLRRRINNVLSLYPWPRKKVHSFLVPSPRYKSMAACHLPLGTHS